MATQMPHVAHGNVATQMPQLAYGNMATQMPQVASTQMPQAASTQMPQVAYRKGLNQLVHQVKADKKLGTVLKTQYGHSMVDFSNKLCDLLLSKDILTQDANDLSVPPIPGLTTVYRYGPEEWFNGEFPASHAAAFSPSPQAPPQNSGLTPQVIALNSYPPSHPQALQAVALTQQAALTPQAPPQDSGLTPQDSYSPSHPQAVQAVALTQQAPLQDTPQADALNSDFPSHPQVPQAVALTPQPNLYYSPSHQRVPPPPHSHSRIASPPHSHQRVPPPPHAATFRPPQATLHSSSYPPNVALPTPTLTRTLQRVNTRPYHTN